MSNDEIILTIIIFVMILLAIASIATFSQLIKACLLFFVFLLFGVIII